MIRITDPPAVTGTRLPNHPGMRLLVFLLLVTLPALADPGALRIAREGSDLRLRSDSPLQVRARMVGARMRVDVSPASFVANKVPRGVAVSRPGGRTLRLEWAAPARSVARCVRARDGRAVRVVVGRASAGRPRRTVNQDFVNADVVYVIKVLAKAMGRNVYIGPGVDGMVTLSVRSAPPEAALAVILALHESAVDYKVVSNGGGGQTLIVAPTDKLATIPDAIPTGGPVRIPNADEGGGRQEILLEKAPAAQVMEFLRGQYKNVQFTLHPTMNGFYVYGTRKDVLQIKAEIPNLDRVPDPPPPTTVEFVAVKYEDINEVKALLQTLVPDVEYAVDTRQNVLRLTGKPGAIEQVKELLAEFDRPTEQVVIDAKLVVLPATQTKEALYVDLSAPIQVLPRPRFSGPSYVQYWVRSCEARVLAAPRVATQSDRPVSLNLGDTVAPGFTVTALPSVKAEGVIELQLDVENRFRKETHQLRIEDGDTIVLSSPLRCLRPGSQVVLMLTPHIMR